MSKKITDRVKFCLNRHNDANSAQENLQEWTTERRDFFLSKLDWIEKSLDEGNHEAYRIAYNQLKLALNEQKNTLDKLHNIMLFEDNK